MKLDRALLRLPLRLEVAPLREELEALPARAWRPHPQGFPGNDALPLIACGGDPEDDRPFGVMAETPWLARCPTLRRTLAALGCPLGRTRVMRLGPGASVQEHVDAHPYWWDHLRLHVPLRTTPEVLFFCGYQAAHMAEGEVWVFDTWRRHRVHNGGEVPRWHLVCDTVGAPALWRMIEAAPGSMEALRLDPAEAPLALERFEPPPVASADSLDRARSLLLEEEPLRGGPRPDLSRGPLLRAARDLCVEWRALEAAGAEREAFAALRDEAAHTLGRWQGLYQLKNGLDPVAQLRGAVLELAIPGRPTRELRPPPPRFDRPVVLLSPPRSGSSVLFEALQCAPGLYSIGEESHDLVEALPSLTPAARGFVSHALCEDQATPEVLVRLRRDLFERLRDRDARVAPEGQPVRVVEKTPKSCLRLPFLERLLPDARYVVLLRSPRDSLSSMLDGWRSGRFVTCPRLPGWTGLPWSFLLTPGWRRLIGAPLWQVVAEQWRLAAEGLLEGLAAVEPERILAVRTRSLVEAPGPTLRALAQRLELDWPSPPQGPLPLSRTTLTPPSPDKWRRNAAELEQALPRVAEVAARLEARLGPHLIRIESP